MKRVLLLHRGFAAVSAPPPPNTFITPKTRLLLQNTTTSIVAFAGISSALVYFSPWFPATKQSIQLAWRWTENSPFDDEYESMAWQMTFGAMGLLAGWQASQQILLKTTQSTASSFLLPFKIPFMVFCGVLGAKLTISTSKPAADAVLLIGRMVEYSLNGLLVDLGAQQLHELEWGHRIKLAPKPAAGAKQKEEVKEFLNSGDELHDLSIVSGSLDDLKQIGAYGHKLLLVKELGKLRMQEKLIKERTQSMDREAARKILSEIEEHKKQVKQQCVKVHGFKIGRLFEEIQNNAASKLNALRETQVNMVLEGEPKMSALKQLDREKAKLKREARLALNVKLSRFAKPYPKWKHVWKDVARNK